MPKIKVEIEVDKDYCDGYFDCPILDRDKYGEDAKWNAFGGYVREYKKDKEN